MKNKIIEYCNSRWQELEEGEYTVYCHFNIINSKFYIGITKQIPAERWGKNGNKYQHCTKFWSAIQKYGWDNFEHIILFEKIKEDNAYEIEKDLISHFKLQDNDYGYNISDGGDENPMKNRTHSLETRKKISEKGKEYYKTHEHPWLNKHHTDESKEKMMLSNHDRQEVMCVETGVIYPSIREAAKQMNLKSKNSIIIALNDETKTARKYHWRRIENERSREN